MQNTQIEKCLPPVEASQTVCKAGWFLLLLLALLLVVGAGCQTADQRSEYDYYMNGIGEMPQVQSPETQGKVDYSTNLLHEGDVVDVNFQYSTNFNTVQKINLDGTLNMSTVGKVQAAGLTVLQLQDEITRLYKPQVKDDVITVKLVSAGESVTIGGAVVRPGPLELSRPMTVLEAVMASGGFDISRAKLTDVKVLRIEQGRQKVYTVNLKRILAGRDPHPFYLRSFDIVYVPAKTFNY